MFTCHTESLERLAQCTQHLCTLLHIKLLAKEVGQFAMSRGNGRGKDHQRTLWREKRMRDECHIVLVMNLCTLLFQLARKRARSLVITTYLHADVQEITGDSAHAYAANAHEIYCFDIFEFHFYNPPISL